MKKKYLLWAIPLIIIIVLAFSWKPILLSIAGFKQPQVESRESVISYIDGQKARFDALAIPVSEKDFYILNSDFAIPGIVFFNKQLIPVKSATGEGCPKVARSFITSLDAEENFTRDTSVKTRDLNELFSKIKFIKGDSSRILKDINENKYDFIAVYTWAKYFPKQCALMMQAGNEALQNKKAKILTISVNMDYVKDWHGNEPIEIN